jgi:hypothetical protein
MSRISLQPRVVVNLQCLECGEIGEDIDLRAAHLAGWRFREVRIEEAERVILVNYEWVACPRCLEVTWRVIESHRATKRRRQELYRDPLVRAIIDELGARLVEVR